MAIKGYKQSYYHTVCFAVNINDRDNDHDKSHVPVSLQYVCAGCIINFQQYLEKKKKKKKKKKFRKKKKKFKNDSVIIK